MTPFECFKDFVAVSRHFTSDYDYEKYNGRVRLRVDKFESRPDRYWFEKMSRHHDPHWLIVANLVEKPNAWAGDVARDRTVYAARKGRVEALDYTVHRDLEKMTRDARAELVCVDGTHPALARRCLAGQVSLETACVASSVLGLGRAWSGTGDSLLREFATRLTKYAAFLKFDRDKYRALLSTHFCIDTSPRPDK